MSERKADKDRGRRRPKPGERSSSGSGRSSRPESTRSSRSSSRKYRRPEKQRSRRSRRSDEEKIALGLNGLNVVVDDTDVVSDELTRKTGRLALIAFYVIAAAVVITVIWSVASYAYRARQAGRSEPLLRAAETGTVQDVAVLLERGADPDAAAASGLTPLVAATRRGAAPVVRALLEAGATPSAAAVALAVRHRHEDVLRALIEGGADPNQRLSWSNKSLLETAAAAGDVELARLLIAHGADVNAKDPLAMPALLAAAGAGNAEMVRVLLSSGADPKLSWHGRTAVEIAIREEHRMVVEVLREWEARG
ncbi:MAG: ankyrin repeat domain-containing protein [candidate division WS1 bacterium]|nr:ankyrin repeat domain-containing protein [candidate division WS1 bacterium]